MKLIHQINTFLFKIFAHIKYPIPVWNILNTKYRRSFKKQQPELSPLQKDILTELSETGIATAKLEDLFPDQNLLETFTTFVRQTESNGKINHKKKFLFDYWDEVVALDLENPFLKTALSSTILDIVNSYMGMHTLLQYFTLQKTIPAQNELTNSQNWHRDPQEQKIVKVFIYLNDIDDTAGPFTYIRNSAPTAKHPYAKLFPQQPPKGSYPGNDTLLQAVKEEDISPMTAPAGTVIFCDTNGLHYGGVATEKERIMSTFGYTAHTFKENQTYYYDKNLEQEVQHISPATKSILKKKWRR